MTINEVRALLKERAEQHLKIRNTYGHDEPNKYFHDGAQIALRSVLQTIDAKLSKEGD